ncbi:MAG: two-component sensor histidine kinase, partial [Nocardioidaceae bacterium]|nr:two-component sensor histidine kinase [Nocardioidaceae bacterium]
MAEPENFQPRLNAWSHVWRAMVVVGISGLAWWEIAGWQWNHHRPWFFVDIGLGLTAFALAHWRRRYPLTIALITAALTAVSGSAAGPATLALVSLATRRRWRELVPAAIVSAGSAAVFAHLNPTDNSDGVAVFIS